MTITRLCLAITSIFCLLLNIIPAGEAYRYDYEKTVTLSREYRKAKNTDDFLERGNAEVTESPIFEEGIRLSAQGVESEEEPQFSLASAIYYFDISERAQSLAITVSYRSGRAVDDEEVGRLWVRDVTKKGDDDTLHGATFALRAKKRRERIHLAAANYVDKKGVLEIHLVVQGQEELDVEYIEVEAYDYMPKVRIVERYNYLPPRPWYRYYYNYYYTGPYYTIVRPYHYVLYEDWWYDDWYGGIRFRFDNYLTYHPHPYRYYRHYWRDRDYYHYYRRGVHRPVIVHQLPRPRVAVLYVNSGFKKRRFYSRSRLDNARARTDSGIVSRRRATTENPAPVKYSRSRTVQRRRIESTRSIKRRASSTMQQQNIRKRIQPRPRTSDTSDHYKRRRSVQQYSRERTQVQRSPSSFTRSSTREHKRRPSSYSSHRTSPRDNSGERRKKRRR